MYTPVLDDISLESGLGMVKHDFQSMLVLLLKRGTYPYEMYNRRSLENLGETGEGALIQFRGRAPAERDERVEGPIVVSSTKKVVVDEIIIEFRESSEDPNDIYSGEDACSDPDEIEEEKEIEIPLPNMGVPPLEENDEPYPNSWIREMDMDAGYMNTMVPGVDEDHVPPPVSVGVGQRRERDTQITTHLCPLVDVHLWIAVEGHLHVVAYGGGIFQTGEHKVNILLKECTCRSFQIYQISCIHALAVCGVIYYDFHQLTSEYYHASINLRVYERAFDVPRRRSSWVQEGPEVVMTDTPLLFDKDSHRSETIWHGEVSAFWWNVRRTNATNPCGNLILYMIELNHQRNYQVTPLEDVEHVTRISRKGRAGEDWAAYHRDYIVRWQARAETVVTGSRAHTPRHAPSEYMTWYFSVTRQFVSPPPTEPAMVYHARGYTKEALYTFFVSELGLVRNVVEHVQCGEAMDPLLADPYMVEIGHYCQSILHSLPLLEGMIVGGDLSRGRRARRWSISETTLRVEDPDELPIISEPTVPDLLPVQTPELEPEQPPEPQPDRHPPICRIYTRRQKKAIGAPDPSSAL
ncbi:hypothetical protein H6P81_002789 [Aristolochia fimbriata]|uniref:SWIM-type domain-containing protein n=1 Tax=Aristolochia fimbriata TaxID=158543 RepID=A0AAV7FEL4_ARIFI|nr:hypothetical protein H6P81_002789 [Aristolochia fimbriata]